LISIILIVILSQVTYYIDKKLIINNSNPIFVVHVDTADDGGSTQYLGLGYEIIHWNVIKDEDNNFVNGYEINRFPTYKDMNGGTAEEFK